MKIAVLAHIRHAIAEPFSGGMEAHCAMLSAGLRQAGHEVDLFAAAGSQDAALVPICDAPYDVVLPWHLYHGTPDLHAFQSAAFEQALLRIAAGEYDVVHNNSLFPQIVDWCDAAGIPCVTSQHVPPFSTMFDMVERTCNSPNIAFTVTSTDQQTIWAERGCTDLSVVPNGVDTQRWCPAQTHGDHFTWVGRIVPNKGLGHAVRAARLAGVRLKIFGPVEDPAYFAREVEPYLTDGIEFHGHVSAERLQREVADARGAVVTPLWDEPFGLVAAEALACGTPVIGFDRGALSEVVGDCGVLVKSGQIESLAAAFAKIDTISRDACRGRAIAHLSIGAMIEGYAGLYEKVIAGARLASLSRLAWSSSCSSTSALLA